MILVIDASVAIKWFLHFRSDEAHADRALEILAGIDACEVELIQPPHFVAEIAAVLAREKPKEAITDLDDLLNVAFKVIEEPAIYATATDLSIRLNHHLFDTLYHATALHTAGAVYITADGRYYGKAKDFGQIALLAEFELSRG